LFKSELLQIVLWILGILWLFIVPYLLTLLLNSKTIAPQRCRHEIKLQHLDSDNLELLLESSHATFKLLKLLNRRVSMFDGLSRQKLLK
jgi:hypothetical protein